MRPLSPPGRGWCLPGQAGAAHQQQQPKQNVGRLLPPLLSRAPPKMHNMGQNRNRRVHYSKLVLDFEGVFCWYWLGFKELCARRETW
jgi:hypothetical protein